MERISEFFIFWQYDVKWIQIRYVQFHNKFGSLLCLLLFVFIKTMFDKMERKLDGKENKNKIKEFFFIIVWYNRRKRKFFYL